MVTPKSHTSLLFLVSGVFLLYLVIMGISLAAFSLDRFFTSQLRNSHATLFTFIKLQEITEEEGKDLLNACSSLPQPSFLQRQRNT